jgi:hypothetical protein
MFGLLIVGIVIGVDVQIHKPPARGRQGPDSGQWLLCGGFG